MAHIKQAAQVWAQVLFTLTKGNIMKNYILQRLHEASTWRGIVLLLAAAGVALSPEQGEAIVACGLALAGVLGAFLPDPK